MNYSEALKYVHSIPKFVRPLGNEKLSGLLMLMDNPQNKLKFVHVAGTNGKGSVCSMTAEILTKAGYKTGLFTSPFIEVFNERIRINGEIISDDELCRYITDTAKLMEENDMQVSEFAFITAVAMKYFSDSGCEIVVLETGMGGRLDATNIIPPPLCSVLTSISLDHTQYLGDTIEKIALEKCGIIKMSVPTVSAPNTAVRDIIINEAYANNSQLVICEKAQKTEKGFIYKDREYPLGLSGEYQAENGAVAVEIVDVLRNLGYAISDEHMYQGLADAKWKARYEFITPDIVIDGGHNADGIRVLKESLISENRPITLVMAMMQDKDYSECIKSIAGIAKNVIATELDMPRALKACEIKSVCDKIGIESIVLTDIKSAIEEAVRISDGGLVCICGSLYLAGEAIKILKEEKFNA